MACGNILDGVESLPSYHEIEIEGVNISAETLVGILKSILRPIPGRWYKYKRVENEFGPIILVDVKTDGEHHG